MKTKECTQKNQSNGLTVDNSIKGKLDRKNNNSSKENGFGKEKERPLLELNTDMRQIKKN